MTEEAEETEVAMETRLKLETVETDEYVMTKYSNKQIYCDLTEVSLASFGSGEKLALGIAVLAASARGNGSAVKVIADPGSIYAYAVPPRGKLVPALIESEDEALRKLGWRKAEADDGWFFDTEGGRRED
jgi:hypothetical protein